MVNKAENLIDLYKTVWQGCRPCWVLIP